MKKIIAILCVFVLFSCETKKVIELPKAKSTIVADVENHCPIYIFFKLESKDTIADVNRKNSISSANWIFNIDKRLPLKKVLPELEMLIEKKENSSHKDTASRNFFAYANSVSKTMAFLKFEKLKFEQKNPINLKNVISFDESDLVILNGNKVKKNQLSAEINKLLNNEKLILNLAFQKKSSYQVYIENKVFLTDLVSKFENVSISETEYIY